MDVDDDTFFAELNRRISLIIMEDDEVPVATYPSVSLQDFSGVIYNPNVHSPYMYEQTTTCRREISKGTGVFIPQSPQLKRKSKRGRSSSFNPKSHHNQTTHGYMTNSSINTSNNPSYSFNKS